MPGVSGVIVVTNARAFYTTRAHSLHPLFSEGRTIRVKLAQTCGEITKLRLQMILFETDSGWAKGALRAVPTIHRQFHPERWARFHLRSSSYGGRFAHPPIDHYHPRSQAITGREATRGEGAKSRTHMNAASALPRPSSSMITRSPALSQI